MASKQEKLEKLKALQHSYGQQLPLRIQAIEHICLQLAQHLEEHPRLLPELHRLVHSLAGSAGSFGYGALSEHLRFIEQQLTLNMQQMQYALTPDQLVTLTAQVADLSRYLMVQQLNYNLSFTGLDLQQHDNRYVYIIEDDVLLAEEIQTQLSIYGWQAVVFHQIRDLENALLKQLPAAMIVDIMLPEGDSAGTDFVKKIQQQYQGLIPVIIISSRWDWQSRLAAAQAGANAYLTKPIDFGILAERLDILTLRNEGIPYQVLVIEDNELLAEHYAAVLTNAGMHVETLKDPTQLLAMLEHFSPELVLLDLYMPHCNGIEVARVIRQDTQFIDLPIVFLSTESGRHLQLAAMQSGADDFLQKPIQAQELVMAVKQRAERFRSLRELIRQDRMTGLLNHIAFRLQLEFELARQQRTGSLLSMVMLDIDYFKKVNDQYGHPIGDRVIKSLAKLLTNRLRKTDVIGRYGGEEFGIIMPDTHPDDALKVMNQLREEFAQLIHMSQQQEFSTTFSAGLVVAKYNYQVDDLFQYADQALYQAKQQGRNCVVLYENSTTT
ncbi:diguanylate cyclase [Agitococcus lubricus]|uniref:diguanylate cyclase n=1 Tax=Agitococcus lubricus TaxID=1077255 RepID=A0A2T5IYL6_9GAMM|nr:diguanylate cyclase [Agitococcus lubricus]PTQ89027.1 response regulator receiver modulated diguanylate cyclase [Agitococcus lubricus]